MWYLISAEDLERYLDEGREMLLVDMRDPSDYAKNHIQGAVNIPGDELMERLFCLPFDKLIVLYCYHGPNSMLAARQLAQRGYRAADVYGGILSYHGKYLVQSR